MSDDRKQTVTIDEVEYNIDDLSDEAKTQLLNLKFVDDKILQLNNEWAISDTARIGYTQALQQELAKLNENSSI